MQRKGFTLIELLIVIGLLAALAAVLLPSLMGDRTKAFENICNYNQAGTMRTLRQFESMTSGMLPNGMHTGLDDADGPLAGLPTVLAANMKKSGKISSLGPNDIAALASVGITKLAYGSGDAAGATADDKIGFKTLVGGETVAEIQSWHDDAGKTYSFNGKTYELLEEEGYTAIIPLFIAPTTDWTAPNTAAWVKGFSVSMDMPGSCPVPEGDFTYYMAYVGLKSDGCATYTASAVNDGVSVAPPVPSVPEAVDENKMQDYIDEAVTAAGSDWDWDTAPGNDWSTGSRIAKHTNGTVATYVVTFDATPKAKLLGTSCPECGITNP